MHAGPAHAAAINKCALGLGLFVGRFANRRRLLLGMIGELVQRQNFDFVVREIGFAQVRALLKDHDAKTVRRKLFSQNAAGSAGADDHEIHFVRSLVLGLVHGHFFSASFISSFAATSQPG